MTLRILIAISALCCSLVLTAQTADTGKLFNPRTTYGLAAAYTAPSQDIFVGLAPSRELFLLSATVDWRVHEASYLTYRWEVEVLPLVLIRNPHVVADVTTVNAGTPPNTQHYDQLSLYPCISGTFTGADYGPGMTLTSSYQVSRVCDTLWTYAGGVSPLGQRLNFRPRKRLQPFAQANAGFIASTRPVPLDDATRFNFTAELGGGIEYFYKPRRSIAFDVIYHHLSNGGSGDENPSIENFTFKTNFRWGH